MGSLLVSEPGVEQYVLYNKSGSTKKISFPRNNRCHSKGFRKFLIVATGTFVGAFLALSLFAALHRPPMPVPMPMPAHCPCQQMMFRPDFGPQHFYRGHRGDFHKKMMKHRMENNAPRPVQEADD